MPLYESPAVILRTIRLGEADKIATLFTERFGKVKAVAKGALRPKSRFGGRLEPFSLVRAIFFGKEKTELYRLNSLDMLDPFMTLRGDFEKLGRAWVSVELVDALQREGDENRRGFESLLELWRALTREERPARMDLLLRLFELRYISGAGFQPVLDRCSMCRGELEGAEVWFDPVRGGAVCRACAPAAPSAVKTAMGAVRLMARGLSMPPEKLSRLSAGEEVVAELGGLVRSYVSAHVRRQMRSESFLSLGSEKDW
ncbi:MAG: DNA repair protein RecO [Candidatus Nitrospinota bacterium M3_3B_026]